MNPTLGAAPDYFFIKKKREERKRFLRQMNRNKKTGLTPGL